MPSEDLLDVFVESQFPFNKPDLYSTVSLLCYTPGWRGNFLSAQSSGTMQESQAAAILFSRAYF